MTQEGGFVVDIPNQLSQHYLPAARTERMQRNACPPLFTRAVGRVAEQQLNSKWRASSRQPPGCVASDRQLIHRQPLPMRNRGACNAALAILPLPSGAIMDGTSRRWRTPVRVVRLSNRHCEPRAPLIRTTAALLASLGCSAHGCGLITGWCSAILKPGSRWW